MVRMKESRQIDNLDRKFESNFAGLVDKAPEAGTPSRLVVETRANSGPTGDQVSAEVAAAGRAQPQLGAPKGSQKSTPVRTFHLPEEAHSEQPESVVRED